jgi:PAS domain S-box-containing protein
MVWGWQYTFLEPDTGSSERKTMRIEYKILTCSIICGLSVWLIDAYVGHRLFHEGTFWELLITNAPTHELYVRTSVFAFFIAFGVWASSYIAKRRGIEEALENSREFLQMVIDSVPDGVVLITNRRQADAELKTASVFPDSMSEALHVTESSIRIIRVNEASCRLWGYCREEMLGKSATELFTHKESLEHGQASDISTLFGRTEEFEAIALTKTGRRVLVTVSGQALKNEQGNAVSFVCVVRDITQRKRAEEALIRYQTQLRSLMSQLVMTEERERKEIEAALHDDLLQKLALCKMRLDELSQSEPLKDRADSLKEIAESVREMIRRTRSLTFDLISPVLYDIGLEAAIRDWLDREVGSKYDIVFEFEDDGHPRWLDHDLRVTLYRAVRELCTNVIKHSQAEQAKVLVRSNGDNIEIIVEDNGVGMQNPNEENDSDNFRYRGGLGLFGIRERLDHFGAGMYIDSEPGAGTRISIVVPSRCQATAERTRT